MLVSSPGRGKDKTQDLEAGVCWCILEAKRRPVWLEPNEQEQESSRKREQVLTGDQFLWRFVNSCKHLGFYFPGHDKLLQSLNQRSDIK